MDVLPLSLGLVCIGQETMNDSNTGHDVDADAAKSKSQIKREYKALQALGQQLVALSEKQLINIPLTDAMRDHIVTAKKLKHGVLNRQLRLIGRRMVEEDVDAIRHALEKLKQPHRQAVRSFHRLEQWRDDLLRGDAQTFAELVEKFDDLDRQYVNQLIRNANREQQLQKPPKSARLLFQYLETLSQSG